MTCSHGLEFVWVDTCCNGKSSSAELSEAIDSMFRWYQRSSSCYFLLSHITKGTSWQTALPHCRWFALGWTPRRVFKTLSLFTIQPVPTKTMYSG